jgi:beta-lactamase class A
MSTAALFSRRRLLASAMGWAALTSRSGALARAEPAAEVSAIERSSGGRIGLAVLNLQNGARLAHRADERFAMCSTFKLMLAAAVFARIDAGILAAAQLAHYTPTDLLPNSEVTQAHAAQGVLPLATLLQAVIEVSDNTAANLLLGLIGGPPGYTQFVRTLGDEVTRLDRTEMALNSNLPDDPRDTTTPHAMLANLVKVLTGPVLSVQARERLLTFMRDCRTGTARLRAQLPAGWLAGDKTGTGDNGAVNDLAILWPPGRRPILMACYLSGSHRPTAELNAAHARIGALTAAAFG